MSTIGTLMVLFFIWILKPLGLFLFFILKIAFVLMVLGIIGYIIGYILARLRLTFPILCLFCFYFYSLFFHTRKDTVLGIIPFLPEKLKESVMLLKIVDFISVNTAETKFFKIIALISLICTLIGIIHWFHILFIKAVKKSVIYQEAKVFTITFLIVQFLLTILYPFEIYPSFKSACYVLIVLIGFGPAYMYNPISYYNKIKNILSKKGTISKHDLEDIIRQEEQEKNQKNDREEREKKIKNLNQLLNCIIKYDNSIFIFEGKKEIYYLSYQKVQDMIDYINIKINEKSWVFIETLVKDPSLLFDKIDLKIFIMDMMPKLSIAHKNNKEIIAFNDLDSISGLCDCCHVYSEILIQDENGRYCSYECQNFMETLYDSMTPNINAVARTIELSAIVATNPHLKAMLKEQQYYTNKPLNTRHGQMAEVLNTKKDLSKSIKSEILGKDNAKNGLDRISGEVFIQDKYYNDYRAAIRSTLDNNGNYRYSPNTELEMPKEQIADAQEYIKELGLENQIKLRAGVSLKAAKLTAKAGNIYSITYDVKKSAISCGIPAFKTSFILNLAYGIWSEDDIEIAFENAAIQGLKSSTAQTVIATTSAQIQKIKIIDEFMKRNKIDISHTISFIVYSGKDFYDFFNNYISSKQLVINLVSTGAGFIAGNAARTALTGLTGPVGFLASIATTILVQSAVKSVSESLTSSDAKEMQSIFYSQLELLSREYMLTTKEIQLISNEISNENPSEMLKLMYHDTDHYRYAAFVILTKIAEKYSNRIPIKFV
ncbi:hypothetical protein [Clostridium sp. MD294]|uniref:hypothetical protein n=1 Tax=Clostridium sp. MD294 TaxID=97138 RepID=UPI0012E9AAA6|nr:hypothetical protein [Clostridium sp. MD294]NDO47264.1 hypothetical protein [Clostridium sp. MD294]